MSKEKWSSYTGLRSDVVKLVKSPPASVLDVGCSNGVNLAWLKSQFKVEKTVGIEMDERFVSEARAVADVVVSEDLDVLADELVDLGIEFDLIICADVLEHLKNPSAVLNNILRTAKPGAQLLISLPNVSHWTVIKNLILGVWPQRDRGIFDRTHLRWFTLKTIYDLARSNDFEIESVSENFRILDEPGGLVNRFSSFLRFLPGRRFFTYQYVVSCRVLDKSIL